MMTYTNDTTKSRCDKGIQTIKLRRADVDPIDAIPFIFPHAINGIELIDNQVRSTLLNCQTNLCVTNIPFFGMGTIFRNIKFIDVEGCTQGITNSESGQQNQNHPLP